MPTKQTAKKQGKGTVNPGNGFVSVDYEGDRKQVVWEFTNRKDVGCGLPENMIDGRF